MRSRLSRAWRALSVVCLLLVSSMVAVPALAQVRNEGAVVDARGGVVALATGDFHTCGLRNDGKAVCWGQDDGGQASPPSGTFIALSAGGHHTCGLRGDGSVECWGQEVMAPPGQTGNYVAIASGRNFACGLGFRGDVDCWGNAAPEGKFIALSAGRMHACGLHEDGRAECWGNNDYGQATAPADAFIAIAAGDFHTCGLRSDGSATCWGENNDGQATVSGGIFTALSAGGYHSCGLRLDGGAQCWGYNYNGEANAPAGAFTAISTGVFHSCGLRSNGQVACWGHDYYGQASPPQDVFGPGSLDAGDVHTCQARADGTLNCWGDDVSGQTYPPQQGFHAAVGSGDQYSCAQQDNNVLTCWGHDGFGERNTPTLPVRQFGLGRHHGCAVSSFGNANCWGWNSNGQGGAPAGLFREVNGGFVHSCGLRDDGSATCWGFNGDGQTSVPALDEGMFFRTVQAGDRHSCGLRSDGFIVCWGLDYDTQAAYPPTGYFRALSVGSFHNCAIRNDGRLACWGANWWGQTDAPIGTYVSVSAGYSHTCAIRTDSARVCWGDDAAGQAPNLALQPFDIPGIRWNLPYSTTLELFRQTSNTPVASARFEVIGELPPGLALGNDGVLSGTPTTTGTYPVTIQAVSTEGFGAAREYLLSVDASPPQIDYYRSGYPGINDWWTSNVTLYWYAYDYESRVTTTSGCEDVTITTDTPGIDFTCTAESAGGAASRTVTIRRDTVAPETALTATPGATSANATATFEFSGTDATSGVILYEFSLDGSAPFAIAETSKAVTVAPGTHTFRVRAVDGAGNRDQSWATHTWVVDPSAPVITPTVTGALGQNGWYVGDVQVSWSVADPESAIASSTGCNTVALTTDTIGASFTCTATSAGGTTSQSVTVKRDATAPVIAAAATTTPNAAGWYRDDVTVAFACSDAASGGVSCPAAQVLGGEGGAVASSARSISDAAGNSAISNVVTVKIDRTAPTLTSTVTPGMLLLNSTVQAMPNGNDALSGIAGSSCAALATGSIGNKTVVCTVTDVAGNGASGSATYRVVYGFNGFSAPVQNLPTLNVLKAGRSAPFRWRVVDAQGAPVSNLTAASLGVTVISCPSATENRISVYGGGNSQLQNLGNGYYQLDWPAPSSYRNTCKRLNLDLGDGEAHPTQFKFN